MNSRPDVNLGMKLKIGVMGSASGELNERQNDLSRKLGEAVGVAGCAMITGACPGLPLEAARGARARGGLVIGISPGLSLSEHVNKYHSPTEAHDVIIYTGSGLMGREVVNIRSSDIVVILGGRSGTLGEFSIAYDEGKLIGVLTGTGGVADEIEEIEAKIRKPTGAVILYDNDPTKLIPRLVEYYVSTHAKHPSCFNGDAVLPG